MHTFQLGGGNAPIVAVIDELAGSFRQLTHAPGLIEQLGNDQGQLITVVAAQIVFALRHL
ncbi:hypothetical protein D3C77_447160 [compost metagenome]